MGLLCCLLHRESAQAGLPGTEVTVLGGIHSGDHISHFTKEGKKPSKVVPIRNCADPHWQMVHQGQKCLGKKQER